ncbi:hypothetical protein JCM24511_09938 [Saitozyma sp. JCM 24511]|nr:hypothetical protein JCM24511_09938 [Saitozyma sp. JCM 24511]
MLSASGSYPRGLVFTAFWAVLLAVIMVFHLVSTSCGPTAGTRSSSGLFALGRKAQAAAMWPAFTHPKSSSPDMEGIRRSFAGSRDFYQSLPVVPLQHDEAPSDVPYSAAILYMMDSRSDRILDALASLETLARNIPFEHPYPILFLQSGDFDDSILQEAIVARWVERIRELRKGSEKSTVLLQRMETMADLIEFVRVDLTPNEEAMRAGVKELDPFFSDVWPGYHSMCRFFSVAVFRHPRIRQLDYYMRMDTDSFMPHELAYDPIAMAFERDLKYLGRVVMDDAGEACHGMWDFVEDFTNSHEGLADRLARNGMRIPAPSPERLQAPISTYYNNFEVVHVPSFNRPDVAEWISSLDTYWRGFYVHRWGDAGLRRVTASMFFEPEAVRVLCSFDYFHRQDLFPAMCTAEDDLRP